jgi:predicted ArsR family transcriptional regulator
MNRLEALSDPTRLRIVQHLERHEDASPVELADAAGVHLNTVRPHLGELEAAGALVRTTAPPVGRGRPALRYRLAPDWTLPSSDFRGLAEVLAATLARGGAGTDDLHAVGVEWGRYLLGRPGDHDIARDVPLALEQLGFSAHVEGSTIELSGCPCPLVLPDRPQMICELAIAVAEGVLAGSGSGLRIGRSDHDPARRSCSIQLVAGAAA